MSRRPGPQSRKRSRGETSRQAAAANRSTAPTHRKLIIAELLNSDAPLSPEQVHARLLAQGHLVLLTTVRARLSNLREEEIVQDSGERSIGESRRCKVQCVELSERYRRGLPDRLFKEPRQAPRPPRKHCTCCGQPLPRQNSLT